MARNSAVQVADGRPVSRPYRTTRPAAMPIRLMTTWICRNRLVGIPQVMTRCSVEVALLCRSEQCLRGRGLWCLFPAEETEMAAIVAFGCSSISQWPEFGMTADVTSVATKRSSPAMAASKDFSPADCQDRHRQLACGRERLAIDRILREGRELVESGMHRAGSRVELGVVAARRFVDRFRIGHSSFQKRSR